MMRGILVDAGPLVAFLHRDDHDHVKCVETLRELREPLLTTWMPVTEAMYLLAFSTTAQVALLEMIERGAVRVLTVETGDLPAIRSLMNKYHDLPMDFADASLVQLANREHIDRIFTLDRRDFSVYRMSTGRVFTIVPD